MKEDEEVIEVGGRLPVRMTMDPAGNWVVVRLWGSFVVSSTTDDPSGARDARIGIHETFPAGVLARGQQLTTRLATCHLVCQPFYHKGVYIVSSRPGGRVRHGQAPAHLALFSFFPLVLLCMYGRDATRLRVLPGWAHVFPVPNVVLACAALPYTPTPEFSHPGLSPSHNACFRGHNDLDRREAYKASAHLCPTVTVSHLW